MSIMCLDRYGGQLLYFRGTTLHTLRRIVESFGKCKAATAVLVTFTSIFCAGNSTVSVSPHEDWDKKKKLHISCCNVLLEGTPYF